MIYFLIYIFIHYLINLYIYFRYYPYINKLNVFELGYIAEKSSHSKGSTVDLTLISKDKVSLFIILL